MSKYSWVLQEIKTSIGTVLVNMLLFSLVFVFFAKVFIENIYESDATYLVASSNIEDFIKAEDVNYNAAISTTYKDIIYSEAFIKLIVNQYDNQKSVQEIREAIEVDLKPNSQTFTIKTIAETPKEALKLNEIISDNVNDFLQGVFEYDRAPLYILSSPSRPVLPLVPNLWRALSMGLILGYLNGVVLVLIKKWRRLSNDVSFVFAQRNIEKLGDIPSMVLRRNNPRKRGHN